MNRTVWVVFTIAAASLSLSACGARERISTDDKATLDCLASQTVVSLTAQVRDGLQAGMQPDELSGLQAVLTAEGLNSAKTLFPNQPMNQTYYEYNVARRTTAVQEGLKSQDSLSDAYQLMTQTLDLGATCVIEGLPS